MAKSLKDIPALAAVAGGDRIKFDTLIGKEITIKGVVWDEGDFGDYAVISFTQGKSTKEESTSCGGEQVVKVLKKAEENDLFPFTATVKAFKSKKFKGKFAYSLE